MTFQQIYRVRWHEYIEIITRVQARGLYSLNDDPESLLLASGEYMLAVLCSWYNNPE